MRSHLAKPGNSDFTNGVPFEPTDLKILSF